MGSYSPPNSARRKPPHPTSRNNLLSDQRLHVDTVLTTVSSQKRVGRDGVGASWQRSVQHKIDPAANFAPSILTKSELASQREPVERLIAAARDELDRLFASVRHVGYTVLLCNQAGVVVDHRGFRDDADRFRYWGSWLGAVWSEDLEGTNGIGTCIIEQRPITIHRSQHFRARHIDLSCSSAPIFDCEGRLLAVLDISSIDPRVSEASHELAGSLAKATARSIEERLFREAFRDRWIVAIGEPEGAGAGMLLAVDRDLHVVGDRRSQANFLSRGLDLSTQPSVWSAFERSSDLLRNRGLFDHVVQLALVGGPEIFLALITPPEPRAASTLYTSEMAAQHTRPRLDLIGRLVPPEVQSTRRGGLSPSALQRVHVFINENIDHGIDLKSMADVAGLSLHHFARAFKQTEGITPHMYLLEQRLVRARELLIATDTPISEIALLSGFSDQSHLTRCLRRSSGLSPGAIRNANRGRAAS